MKKELVEYIPHPVTQEELKRDPEWVSNRIVVLETTMKYRLLQGKDTEAIEVELEKLYELAGEPAFVITLYKEEKKMSMMNFKEAMKASVTTESRETKAVAATAKQMEEITLFSTALLKSVPYPKNLTMTTASKLIGELHKEYKDKAHEERPCTSNMYEFIVKLSEDMTTEGKQACKEILDVLPVYPGYKMTHTYIGLINERRGDWKLLTANQKNKIEEMNEDYFKIFSIETPDMSNMSINRASDFIGYHIQSYKDWKRNCCQQWQIDTYRRLGGAESDEALKLLSKSSMDELIETTRKLKAYVFDTSTSKEAFEASTTTTIRSDAKLTRLANGEQEDKDPFNTLCRTLNSMAGNEFFVSATEEAELGQSNDAMLELMYSACSNYLTRSEDEIPQISLPKWEEVKAAVRKGLDIGHANTLIEEFETMAGF